MQYCYRVKLNGVSLSNFKASFGVGIVDEGIHKKFATQFFVSGTLHNVLSLFFLCFTFSLYSFHVFDHERTSCTIFCKSKHTILLVLWVLPKVLLVEAISEEGLLEKLILAGSHFFEEQNTHPLVSDFLFIYSDEQRVHCAKKKFWSVPHSTFILFKKLSIDRAGDCGLMEYPNCSWSL